MTPFIRAQGKTFAACLSVASLALSAALPWPVRAADTTFACHQVGGVPATVAHTPNGQRTVIRWVSGYFSGSGYTPMTRCREVSERFQTYMNQGVLNYITTGYMNNMPVVCVTGSEGGGCQGLLFTLKSGENASRVLQQLFEVRSGVGGPLNESGERVYIKVSEILGTTSRPGTGSTAPAVAPATSGAAGGSLW